MSIKQDSHSYLVTTNKDDSILIPQAINPRDKVTLEKGFDPFEMNYSHGQELFYKFVSNFTNKLVDDSCP